MTPLPPSTEPASLSPEELQRRQAKAHGAQRVLWLMRGGIVLMLLVIAVLWWKRTYQSEEQLDLIRYVQIDLPVLRRYEAPALEALDALLADKKRQAPEVRRELSDEIMPALIRLRRAAEAPRDGAQTAEVRALAREYLGVVESLIQVCRTALLAIDDPTQDPQRGLSQIRDALRVSAENQAAWRRHVAEATERHGLSRGSLPQ